MEVNKLERRIIVLDTGRPANLNTIVQALNDGFILDENVHKGSFTTENAVVYHLIKYTPEDLEKQAEEAEQQSLALLAKKPRVVDSQYADTSANRDEVNKLLKQGYRIEQEWAKKALLYLYDGEQKPEVKDS